jgi:outer membrane protein
MFERKFGRIVSLALMAFLVCGGMVMALPGKALAADASAVGVVDYALLLNSHPDMPKTNETLKAEAEQLKKEFESKASGLSDKDKQELDTKLKQRWMSKERELMSAIMNSIKTAIREVAEAKGLTVVVDKAAVLYGGQDITGEVGKKVGAK